MLFLSEGCRRLTGYSPDELVGNHVRSYAELITGEALVHHGVSGDDVPFVQKPFSPESLTRAVREALDGA